MGKLEAKLDGKIALITGGSSGNRASRPAKRFCRGRRPCLHHGTSRDGIGGRRQGHRQKTSKALKGDVSNLDDLDRILSRSSNRTKGRLDIVFANAGIAKYAALGEITEELYDAILRHQCERHAVHGAEGAAADAGRGRDHSYVLGRRQQRAGGEQRLCRHQSGGAVLRPHLDHRFEAAPHPCERHQPGLDRHAGLETGCSLHLRRESSAAR